MADVPRGAARRTRAQIADAAHGRDQRSASWYLDPLVARQKGDAFLTLVARFWDRRRGGLVLKTDLFEEANGDDALAHRLQGMRMTAGEARRRIVGVEVDLATAQRARRRFRGSGLAVVVGDLRRLGLRDSTFELVVSPSTLDHFATRREIATSLDEICRVLRPGGTVVVILDNPSNPLYHALRWAAPLVAPFRLGRTLGRRGLYAALEGIGFEVLGHDYAIHNPRGISTLVNLTLRALLGRRAEWPIQRLLALFALLDRLPTRVLSACFVAVGARRVDGVNPVDAGTAGAPR